MKKVENNTQIKLYLVISQTGSMLSRVLKLVTGARYNHSSISIDNSMTKMYSFGRRHTYNPFWGGFVKESIREGMYKRCKNTRAAIFEIPIAEDTYNRIIKRFEEMYQRKKQYRYNTIGLFAALFGIHFARKNRYYCSDFVYEILTEFNVIPSDALGKIVKPIDFYRLFNENLIFEGKFCDYTPKNKTEIAHQSSTSNT